MAWPMPARVIRKVITCPEMKMAAMVAMPQAISEMISIRRRSSRCSMTDMRSSSTGAVERGPRWRTLSRSAIRRLLGRLGFGRSGLGGLGLGGARHLVGDLAGRLAELPHRLAHRTPELRQPARPEDDEHDGEDDDEPQRVKRHLRR